MKLFRIVKPGTNEDVFGGTITEGNAYLTAYPEVHGKPVSELEVGETTRATYRLGGSKGTYDIVRVS